MAWRYLAQRVPSGEFIDLDVPLQGVNIEHVLSGHNALNATITPETLRLMGEDGRPLFEEWGTAIWAEADGEIRGGGIFNGASMNGPALQMRCVGYTGYLVEMPWLPGPQAGRFFVEYDPLDVVREIWSTMQAQPNGNLGLELSGLKTGLKLGTEMEQIEFDSEQGKHSYEAADLKLTYYETHDLAGVIDKLAQDTPFDYRERHFWDGDVIRHKLDFGYPQIGRRREDLRFVIGENVHVIPTVDRDGDFYASEVMFLGQGGGPQVRWGHATRPTNRLRRVAVVSDPAIRRNSGCQRQAEIEVAARNAFEDISELAVLSTPHAPLGSFDVGDEIYIEGDTGWADLGFWARIMATTIAPDSGNVMGISVTQTARLAA